MKYQLILGCTLDIGEMERSVNRAIEKGWTPLGAVAYDGANFAQAMVLDHTTGQNARRIYEEVMDDKPRPVSDAVKAFYDADGDTERARGMLP